ncbi:hypothetical protein ACOKFD_05910 [Flagellimonas sp. S174]|uniref:hypothetical protein n=1 Tax=Flagellimonas sp. S174 TaxID=3410790 RepID=UPI003BF4B8CD
MKTNLLLAVLIALSFGLKAQVTDTGDKVGIGTTSPLAKLTISGLDSQSWGSGIGLLRSGVDGRILVDTDGMKFRNMTGNKNFIFRNSSNQTTVFIEDNGNVGIGTASPLTGLQVSRSSNIGGKWNPSGGIFMTSQGSHSLIMDTNEIYSTGTLYFGSKSGDIIRFRTVTDTGSNDKVVIKSDGKMGIGTTSPQGNLHVSTGTSGDAIFRLEADSDNNNEFDNPLIQMRQDGGRLGVNIGFSEENFGGNIFGIGTRYSNQESWDAFTINTSNGNVGIGSKNAGSWKLAVNGEIRAKEIKVETGWSDFVFYDNYKLPTLEEVENYINLKGHLKDIPSAEEVKENGIYLGEMDSKLLQKIEELTLYTIQQEKEIKELNEELHELKSLAGRVSEIEKLLLDSKK